MEKIKAFPLSYSIKNPDVDDDYGFNITVEYRGSNSWAVMKGNHHCISKTLRTRYERHSSNRTDYFKKIYRFPLDEAIEIGIRAQNKLDRERKELEKRWKEQQDKQ